MTNSPDSRNHQETVHAVLEELFSTMKVAYDDITVEYEDERPVFMISTPDAKSLIGPDGATLYALQTLVRHIAAQRLGADTPFSLDVNRYRQQARAALMQKARTIAERARSFQSTISMEPMSSYERFVVHNALADTADIETYSEGAGAERRVVIRYTGGLEK